MNTKRPTKKSALSSQAASQNRITNTPEVKTFHGFVTRWLNAELDMDQRSRDELGFSAESRDRVLDLLKGFRQSANAIERRIARTAPQSGSYTLDLDALAPYATFVNLVYNVARGTWEEAVEPAQHNVFPAHETLAAYGLAELTKLGGLDRLRRCGCGRWFFAPQRRSFTCSTPCRKQFWDQTPANREARKLRDQENRKNFRSGSFGSSKLMSQAKQKRGKHAKAGK